eukprot:TRINITY_DN14616_c0_g1_i1.p2 TRINITY_DN14616_c0_g1~~TRINITY_DN14616_c0_g1_i1.p2  ORF type:complete len:103 (-),score=12.38 TRINITY_DN14616_c0_g1_i1:2-310(-)
MCIRDRTDSLRQKIKRVPLLDISKNNLVYKRQLNNLRKNCSSMASLSSNIDSKQILNNYTCDSMNFDFVDTDLGEEIQTATNIVNLSFQEFKIKKKFIIQPQ